jgi:hypothetical protein
MIIEFVSFLAFILLFFLLVFKNFKLQVKLSSLSKETIKLNINNFILSEKLAEIAKIVPDKTDPSSEAFLKFVSDSRDWAYQYIDEVQASLDKFITDIEPEIMYFDTYGDLMSAEPNYNSMRKISVAYKGLKNLLPDDYGKIDT